MLKENFAFRLFPRGTRTKKQPKGFHGEAEASGSGTLGHVSEKLFKKLLSVEMTALWGSRS